MIFCLGDNVLEELAYTEKHLEYDDSLSKQCINLIESNYNCLLPESNQILRLSNYILKNKNVSDNMKKVVKYCFISYTTMFHLTRNVSKRIVISKEIKVENDIYLTPEYLEEKNLELYNKVSLLSEDISDCKFYVSISNKLSKINGADIKF